MRLWPNDKVEPYRDPAAVMVDQEGVIHDNCVCGCFHVPGPKGLPRLFVLCSDTEGWDHVSVSVPGFRRTPTWEEMSHVAQLFFEAEECLVQFRPPVSQYVNYHPFTLHWWRCQDQVYETPPTYLIGPKL